MKKLFAFALLFLISACAQGSIYKQYDQDCNDHFYSTKSCQKKKEVRKQPEKVYVYKEARPQTRRITLVAQRPTYVRPAVVNVPAPAPVAVAQNGCTGCAPVVRETREPVEIVYRKVTYTTVYEPKTTSTVTYEKEPVTNQKIITSTQAVQQPVVKTVVQQPVIKTVVDPKPATPKVSYTIENTHTAAPSELLIDEVK